MAEPSENSDLDKWVIALQEAILEYERATFSDTVLQEARHPRNLGAMLEPDGYAFVHGSCGDSMEIFLRVRDLRIEVAAFLTDGCGPTVACGSMLTKMAWGKSLAGAEAIEAADLIAALDGLPPAHIHCATLAVQTLQEAMADYWQRTKLDEA
jgi:nitrogen fixation NifU-like protein